MTLGCTRITNNTNIDVPTQWSALWSGLRNSSKKHQQDTTFHFVITCPTKNTQLKIHMQLHIFPILRKHQNTWTGQLRAYLFPKHPLKLHLWIWYSFREEQLRRQLNSLCSHSSEHGQNSTDQNSQTWVLKQVLSQKQWQTYAHTSMYISIQIRSSYILWSRQI